VKMAKSKQLARLIGPTLIVTAMSKALNFQVLAIDILPLTYLVGILLFVTGLSIVCIHNIWIRGWPFLITLLGWFFIFSGLFRMFAPEIHQNLQDTPIYGVLIVDLVLLAVGLYLSFEAYWTSN